MPPPDEMPARTGLEIAWDSKPTVIPGEGPSGTTITRGVFQIANLRVVSDAGPLAAGAHTLEWAQAKTPANVRIDDAPAGLYSLCVFDLAPMAPTPYAYEISGTVDVSGQVRPYTIRDTAPAQISVAYSLALPPGGSAELAVELDMTRLVGVVDFSMVPLVGNEYVVEDGSPQLDRVREELDQAFDAND